MSELSKIIENIYGSLQNDNENIDAHIAALKNTLALQKIPNAELDPARIPHPNRQGRKLLQSYFKKRGVDVVFTSNE